MFLQPSYVFRQLPAVFEEYVVPQATCSCILIEDLVCLQTMRSTPNISSPPPPPPQKNVNPLLFSSRWIQPLYPIFAVTLVFALRWSLGLYPKKLSKSIWATPPPQFRQCPTDRLFFWDVFPQCAVCTSLDLTLGPRIESKFRAELSARQCEPKQKPTIVSI